MTSVPDEFARAVIAFRGAEGESWLRSLNATVGAWAARWSLKVGPPFLPLSYNYVATATRADGSRLVLKVCFPDAEAVTEREALRLFDGRGAVHLLDSDEERGALLLERLERSAETRTTSLPSRAGAKASEGIASTSAARPARSPRASSLKPKRSSET